MRIKTLSTAFAVGALIAAPVAAQAADRDAAPITDESEMGGASRLIVLLVVAAAIFAGIEIFGDDNDAVSP